MSQENVVIQRNTYSMMVDANLDIDSTGASNTDLIVRFPLKSVADRFSENINVMIDSVSGRGLSLKEYVRASAIYMKSRFSDIIMNESKELKSPNGQHYIELVYTASLNKFELQFEQRYIQTTNAVIVITFTAEQYQFNNYKEKARKILDSIKLNENPKFLTLEE